MFPWAHTIITKPSGDMAYEAVAAGCTLLFLEPWGEWEENIKKRFIKNSCAYELNTRNVHKQLLYFFDHNHFGKALTKVVNLPTVYRQGATNIVKLQQRIAKS